jgi:ABC-2 type transport system permease protein
VRGFIPVLKRELLALFVTPIAWFLIACFALLEGFFFFSVLVSFAAGQDVLVGMGPAEVFFGQSIFFHLPIMLICPVLTMRTFAEERRSGTIEALLTAPVSPAAVVLGKYVATLAVYVAMWLPTVLYMVLLARFGEIDWRVVGTAYAGVFLLGAAYLSVGTLASSLTSSQLAAAVGSTIFFLVLLLAGFAGQLAGEGMLADVSSYTSVSALMSDFSRGLIDTRRLVFWGSFIVVPIFATVRTVESWRWG